MGTVFISYARADRDYALILATALGEVGIAVWFDDELLPGQDYVRQIRSALQKAQVVVALLSPTSLKSAWVLSEMSLAHEGGIRIVPVLVGGATPKDLRPPFDLIHAFVLDDQDDDQRVRSSREIAKRLNELLATLKDATVIATPEANQRLASAAAETAREAARVEPATNSTESAKSIFVVHGHDMAMLDEVTVELDRLSVRPVVLQRTRTTDDHLFSKFKAIARDAKHAIVLVSGDDVGASYREFSHKAGGAARLEFRARQNVILELGYFYGKLGEENVFVFRKPPPVSDLVVGKFEDPSDLAGKIFEDFSEGWRLILRERLIDAGFAIANPG